MKTLTVISALCLAPILAMAQDGQTGVGAGGVEPFDAAAVIAPLLVLGAILKNAFPAFPNRYIPLLTLVLGTVGYLVKTGTWTGANVFEALIVAAAATGIHSGIKNTMESEAEPAPK